MSNIVDLLIENHLYKESDEFTQKKQSKTVSALERLATNMGDIEAEAEKIKATLDKVGGKIKGTDAYKEMKLLVSLVGDFMTGEYKGISKADIAKIIASIGYVLSPIDVIPDAVPGAGFIDDLFAVQYVIKLLYNEIQDYKKWKSQEAPAEDGEEKKDYFADIDI